MATGRRRGRDRSALGGAPGSKSETGEARPQHGAFEGRGGRVGARFQASVGLNVFLKSGHSGLDPSFSKRNKERQEKPEA